MRSNGFETPNIEYCLEVNGVRVDMNKKLKDVGCSEGTDVFIVAVDGTPLEKYFYLPNEDDAPPTPSSETDLPVEKPHLSADSGDSKLILEPPESLPLQSGPELIEEPAVELVTSSKLEKEPAVVLEPVEKEPAVVLEPVEKEPAVVLEPVEKEPENSSPERPKEAMEAISDEKPAEVEVKLRAPRERKARKEEREEKKAEARRSKDKESRAQQPAHSEYGSSALPDRIVESISAISVVLEGNEDLLSRFAQIEEYLRTIYNQFNDCALENQKIYSKMEEIHYENQLLRDMYSQVTGKSLGRSLQSPSWKRPNSFKKTDEVLDLPDDVDELKKLVHEKYAAALINERRYFQQMKQCNKYKMMAQTASGDEDSLNMLLSQYRSVSDQRDQLKEENLDLKEKIREATKDINQREDQIRQLTETVQMHKHDLERLEMEILKADESNMKNQAAAVRGSGGAKEEEEEEKKKKENLEIQELREEKARLEKDLESVKQENKINLEALSRSCSSKASLEKEVRELKETNEKLQSELEESRKAATAHDDGSEQNDAKMEELVMKNEDLEKSQLLLQEQVKQMESEEAKIRESLEQLRNEAEQAQKREEECRKENESLHSLVGELMEKSEEQEQKEDELMKQLDSIMDSIHASLEERKSRSQGLRSRFCKSDEICYFCSKKWHFLFFDFWY